ncbi:MAG: hypothetical protein HOY71_01710, partial [Nonomuraea sp.]|nr:hypothetical protein [Nonomuraea sp.]
MMAGRVDVNSQTPSGGDSGFDGGIAHKDVEPVWETQALPGWVVYYLIPLLTSGQSWPQGSESKLWELRVEYVKLMNLLISTLDPTSEALTSLSGSLQSPAKPAIFKRLAKLYDDKSGVVAKAQESFSYAKMVDNFARETQYSKYSVNIAFWVAVIAAFIALIAAGFFPLARVLLSSIGTAGGTRIAMIMERLALVAGRAGRVAASGQVTRLAGGAAANKFIDAALIHELIEEIGEEVFIDAYSQWQQIKSGTRDMWDWNKTKASAIGAGAGAIVGTRLGTPVSNFTNKIPGISRLNRIAGDNRGVGNAFLRFPGRALNTGLNNVAASPAGSIVANAAVYGQFSLPDAEALYGGFMGGAGRTNTISPFNPSVASSVLHPVSSLAGVFSDVMAAHGGGPNPPGPGGPLSGVGPTPSGPHPGGNDLSTMAVPPSVPAQRSGGESLAGAQAGRRDSVAPAPDQGGRRPVDTQVADHSGAKAQQKSDPQ